MFDACVCRKGIDYAHPDKPIRRIQGERHQMITTTADTSVPLTLAGVTPVDRVAPANFGGYGSR